MTTDLATLRTLATATRDVVLVVEHHEDDPPTCRTCAICQCDFHLWPEGEPTNLCGACAYDCADKCADALMLARDEIAELRAQIAATAEVHAEDQRRRDELANVPG